MDKLGDEPAYPGVPDYKMDRLLLGGGEPEPMYRILADDAEPGLTKRERACIDLRIPESGIDWLDALIARAQRRDMAKAAMQRMFYGWPDGSGCTELCASAVHAANALLAELAGKEEAAP